MSEFKTDTGVIYYEVLAPRAGSPAERSTLTLLHNFMSTGRTAWGPLLEPLAERYRILLPDLPGHGRSLGHPGSFRHVVMAQQLTELMVFEGAERGHLAGCSSGGMIAQLMLHLGLLQPATLTLVSSTHSVEPATTGAGTLLTPEGFQASRGWMAATAALHDPYRYDGYYEDVLLPGFRRLDGQLAIDLPLDALAGWAMPVCIIHGERDEFFPPVISQRMAAYLPNAELHLVPGQSHALIFRQPWKVRDILVAFLGTRARPVAETGQAQKA